MVTMKAVRLVAAVATLAVLAAACSGDDDEGATTTTAELTAETTTSVVAVDDSSARTYDLPGDRVFPEGVAYDPSSNRAFVSSSEDGTVFQLDLETGEVSEFLAAGADGRTAALGMDVDTDRGRLWIAGGDSESVFVYGIEDGELIASLPVPDPPDGSLINDVTVTEDGDAYVTNSGAPFVYKVSGSGEGVGDIEVWLDYTVSTIPATGAILLNGIASTPDGHLLAIHSSNGQLYRIDIDAKEAVAVDSGGEAVGFDGLALDGTTLYGVTPTAVIVSDLGDDFATASVVGSITDATFAFPTTVALAPGERLLLANSQFDQPDAPVLPFTVSDVRRAVD